MTECCQSELVPVISVGMVMKLSAVMLARAGVSK